MKLEKILNLLIEEDDWFAKSKEEKALAIAKEVEDRIAKTRKEREEKESSEKEGKNNKIEQRLKTLRYIALTLTNKLGMEVTFDDSNMDYSKGYYWISVPEKNKTKTLEMNIELKKELNNLKSNDEISDYEIKKRHDIHTDLSGFTIYLS